MREGFNVESRVCGAIWRSLFANRSNYVADNKISIKPGPRVTKELRAVYSLQERNFSGTYPESVEGGGKHTGAEASMWGN